MDYGLCLAGKASGEGHSPSERAPWQQHSKNIQDYSSTHEGIVLRRMSKAISDIITRMNGYYNDLNAKQAEFMSMDPTQCMPWCFQNIYEL